MDVPTNVLAIELISSPETPKSQSLICPSELRRTFEGLISNSVIRVRDLKFQTNSLPTSVNNPVYIIEIAQPLKHRVSDETDDINIDCTNPPANVIKGTFVHELHAYADVRVGQK